MNNSFFKDELAFSSNPIASSDAVVLFDQYRITVFTSRLFRIEYNKAKTFEDRPTQTVWHRTITEPFSYEINDSIISLTTNDWEITLDTSKSDLNGLSMQSLDGAISYSYGDKDKHNLLGTYRTLDMVDGSCQLDPGLLSKRGITTYNDAESVVFEQGKITDVNRDDIDLYIFGYGLNYSKCIKDFYKISGKTPLIPKYVFGNWWSRYWNYSDKDLKQVINNFEQLNIPLSVCIIDMDWHITDVPQELGGGWTGYTWNKDLFPTPQKFMNWLHSHNLKISMNLHPADGIRPFDDCYEAVCKRMGLDPLDEQIIEFDLTNPGFVEAYFKDIHHVLEHQGVDFWWIDWQQGTTSKMKNLDPLFALNHYHFVDGLNRHKQQYFIFSRWSKLGSHRYPIGFSGDTFSTWESLDFQPYFTATATNVGYGWWSHDIGGHQQGIQSGELYTRWVQLGVFSPVMRLHSTKSHYSKREPWRYDKEVETNVAHYLRLRHKLIPYIHTFNHLHALGNLPLIRPLYYNWPKDNKAYNYKNQYFFGTELMIRPFTSSTIEKLNLAKEKVWFPTNDWFHFFTGEHIKQSGTYTIYGCTRDINVFAKAGAIIPLATNPDKALDDIPKELTVNIFPGADNHFTLIEDKGDALYNTTFKLISTNNKMTIMIDSDSEHQIIRNLHLHFRSIDTLAKIKTNVSHESIIDSDTNTIKINCTFDMLKKIEITISTKNNIIKNPYDLTQDIMHSIEISELDTNVKNEIGYIDFHKPHESLGWLSLDKSLKEKQKDIEQLHIPKYAKQFLKDTVQKTLKNDE